MLKRYIWKIKNIIRWIPILWKDQDWDHFFIYEILKNKLKFQSEHIRKYGYHTRSEKDAAEIDYAIQLIEIVQYEKMMDDAFNNENWNEDELDAAIDAHNQKRKELFQYLEQNIEKWWD